MTFAEAKKHLEPYSPETRTGDAVQVLLSEIESLRGALTNMVGMVSFLNLETDTERLGEFAGKVKVTTESARTILERTK